MRRLFGTNGIREVVGNPLTAAFATAVAGAIALRGPPGRPIVVGWDGRTSSPAFSRIVSATLALAGHRVIEVGLLPTPAVQYLIPRLGAQLGVIVTASHNPPEFNGFKCIAADGMEVPRAVEEAIEKDVEDHHGLAAAYSALGEISSWPGGDREYVEGILGQVDVTRIRSRAFSVVLDVGNGASALTSPTLLRRLGCRVRTLNGHIDGTFPGRPSEPTEANVQDLVRAVPAFGADLGIAHDGDADRAVFVDRLGRFVPGDRVLTLLARDAVERSHGGTVVTPVTGSLALGEAIEPLGGSVVYTRVGSPNVTREMAARRAVFGGEENGGMIFPGFQLARDGGMAAATVLDLLARSDRPLDALLETIPRYWLCKEMIACPADRRSQVIEHAGATLGKDAQRVETLDGVKVHRTEGWILVRASGTEPLLRVFAEARTERGARALADEGLAAVRSALGAFP